MGVVRFCCSPSRVRERQLPLEGTSEFVMVWATLKTLTSRRCCRHCWCNAFFCPLTKSQNRWRYETLVKTKKFRLDVKMCNIIFFLKTYFYGLKAVFTVPKTGDFSCSSMKSLNHWRYGILVWIKKFRLNMKMCNEFFFLLKLIFSAFGDFFSRKFTFFCPPMISLNGWRYENLIKIEKFCFDE